MQKKKILFLALLLIAAALVLSACGGAGGNTAQENNKQLVMAKTPYSYTWAAIDILKPVLEDMGYDVKLTDTDIGPMYLGLSKGDIDISTDIWLPTLHKTYMDKYKGQLDVLDSWMDDVPLGFAVPKYVKDVNTVADLKGKSDMFGGKIIGLEEGAGMMLTARECIDAYDLDYELIPGSTPAMLTEAAKAVKNHEPIIILGWRPHSMMKKFDLKVLKDEKGIWTWDSAYVGVASDLKDRAPDAYRVLNNFHMSIDDIEDMLYGMNFNDDGTERNISQQDKDKILQDLADQWLADHQDTVESWKTE